MTTWSLTTNINAVLKIILMLLFTASKKIGGFLKNLDSPISLFVDVIYNAK